MLYGRVRRLVRLDQYYVLCGQDNVPAAVLLLSRQLPMLNPFSDTLDGEAKPRCGSRRVQSVQYRVLYHVQRPVLSCTRPVRGVLDEFAAPAQTGLLVPHRSKGAGVSVVIGPDEQPDQRDLARRAKEQCDELARAIIDEHSREAAILCAQHFDTAVVIFETCLQRDDPKQRDLLNSCQSVRNLVNDPEDWAGDYRPKLKKMLPSLSRLGRELREFAEQ